MQHGCHGKLLATLGLLGGLCTAGSGCAALPQLSRSTPWSTRAAQAAAEKPATLLAPRMTVAWSIHSTSQQPPQVLAGQDMVGPDGSLRIGPYGTVPVAGLTPDQARGAIEKHVAAYVKQPRVEVTPVDAPPVEAQTQQVVAEIGEPRNEALVQRTEEVPPVLPQAPAPVPPRPEPSLWQLLTRGSEIKPKTVIASSWRRAERTAAPGFVQPAEWLTARQGQDKPAPKPADKPSDKPVVESPLEQLGPPTPAPGTSSTQAPAASILAPIIGAPIVDGPIPGYHVPSAPRELAKVALPPYVIEPPDILLVEYPANEALTKDFPIAGQHLVRPDGTVSLGIYGAVQVAGLTIDQAKDVIGEQIRRRVNIDTRNLNVDVLAYNSKFYYVITDGGGYGEQVFRIPVTGSETVLDAIGQINGLPAVSSKHHIWVARRCLTEPGGQRVLKVDWIAITQHGATETNYQLMPGDRIYVRADKLIKIDTGLAKVLSPIERLLGVTLLGSQTVNSIRTNPNRVNTGR